MLEQCGMVHGELPGNSLDQVTVSCWNQCEAIPQSLQLLYGHQQVSTEKNHVVYLYSVYMACVALERTNVLKCYWYKCIH